MVLARVWIFTNVHSGNIVRSLGDLDRFSPVASKTEHLRGRIVVPISVSTSLGHLALWSRSDFHVDVLRDTRLMLSIPPLPAGTILLVEVGSTAHGTGLPGGEDHDEMGVVIETPAQVLGLGASVRTVMQRTQPEWEPVRTRRYR